MRRFHFLLLCFFLFFIVSCQKDDNPSASKITTGVFVANQGKFPDGNGSVTWLNENTVKETDLFAKNNGGKLLGNTVQSVFFNNGHYFIAVNNAKNIIITDETFSEVKSHSLTSLPRYFVAWGKKTIASGWGVNGAKGEIIVFNENNDIEKTIQMDGAPERMLVEGNSLLVCQSNGFSVDKGLAKIDLQTFSLSITQTLSEGPNSMVRDLSDNIYILCEGYFDWLTSTSYPAALYKWQENTAAIKVLDLPQGCTDLCISASKSICYFHDFNSVYRWKIGDNNAEKINFTVQPSSIYGLAIDEPNNILYFTDPKDFASQGSVIAADLNKGTITTFNTGVAPGQIFVRN